MSLSDFDLFLSSMEDVKPINHDTVTPLASNPSATLAQQEKRKAAELSLANDENYLQSEHVELLDPHELLDSRNLKYSPKMAFSNLLVAALSRWLQWFLA